MFPRLIFEPEHEEFRATCRRFCREYVAPRAQGWRTQGWCDPEAFREAGSRGLLLTWADERHGGAGVPDFRFEQVLLEENVRHGEIGLYLTLHSRIVAPYIGRLGTEAQRARFLPGCARGQTILGIAMTEPGVGSDLASIRTRAERVGSGWRLNGQKTYISNGQIGSLFVVAARVGGERELGLFLVEGEMPGFRRGRRLEKIGLDAQDTSELFFDGVFVSEDHVLGEPGHGLGYLKSFLAEERLIAAVQSLAGAQVAWDETAGFVRERRAFGRSLTGFQNTRFRLAELRAQLDAVQTFVDQCVLMHVSNRLSPSAAAAAKLTATELEGLVVDECLQLHGGAGYMDEHRIARLYRDARVARIYAGTSEVMKEIIAREAGVGDASAGPARG